MFQCSVNLGASSAEGMGLVGDCPDEANQFPRDRGGDHGRQFPGPGQLAIPPTYPFLGLPCRIADRLRQALLPQNLFTADTRGEPITPGGLDQHSPRRTVPCLGDAALSARVAAGMFRRDQAEIRHQLAGIGEAGHVAEFGHQCRRCHQGHAAQCLQSPHHRCTIALLRCVRPAARAGP